MQVKKNKSYEIKIMYFSLLLKKGKKYKKNK